MKPAATVARVAAHFGIPVDVLLGSSRVRSVTYARHIAMWLLRKEGLGYKRIAEALGRSDRTTARYAVRRIESERRWYLFRVNHDLEALSKEA